MSKAGMKTYRREQHQRKRPIGPLALIFGGTLLLMGLVVFVILGRDRAGNAPPPGFQPQAEGPRVSVDQDSIDLGKRALGVPVEAVFHVQNVGNSDLKIQGVPQVEVKQGC